MKKIALTIAMVGFIATSYGQGYVTVAGTYQNFIDPTVLTTAWAGGNTGGGVAIGNIASGQSYNVALLTSTSASPLTTLFGSGAALASTWQDTGLLGHNTTFAGRLSIGTGIVANNAPIGAVQSWILVAWSANLGSTWTSVQSSLASGNFSQAGYLGWSIVGSGASAAAPPTPALTIQGASGSIIPQGLTMLSTVPVPEPGTMALAALSGASLLLFRRRK